jgi:DNA repair protein RadD
MISLRPYQQDAVNCIWNELLVSDTALCVMSTGAGKSRVVAALFEKAMRLKPDIRCLVLFNKVVLLKQQADGFRSLLGDDKVSIYCGTEGQWDLSAPVVVGSIQSLDPNNLNFNLIVVDETHSLNEDGGRYILFLKHQMAQNPKTKVVGLTATPYRYDGYIYGKTKFFKRPCFERGLAYFIDRGHLVPPIAKQPDHQIDLSKLRTLKGEYRQDDIDAQTMNITMAKDQTIDALNRSIGRNKIVWACSSINHAELICKLLIENGEKAVVLHSKMTWEEREDAEEAFMRGDARHLTFVTIVAEGFDFPPVDCIVLMRPTRSPGLMVQICGRGLRPFQNKENCLVLDYANVISTLGPLENPVISKKRKGAKGEAPRQKTCPQCRTYVAPRTTSCPQCGFNWPKEEATKLNLTADEDAALLSKQLRTIEVQDVKMSLHTSKAGNKCIKIDYIPRGFFVDPVTEYFTVGAEFGMRKFILRAIDLHIDLSDTPEIQAAQIIKKKPHSVSFVMENKYPRIKRLIFTANQGD